jgi:hypothetical protein
MKKGLTMFLFLILFQQSYAQGEIGPEGNKLLLVLLGIIALVVILVFILKLKIDPGKFSHFFAGRSIKIEIKKDRRYYPDNLELVLKNNGNSEVDISQPLLVFDNFWFKRKFKLKGTNNYNFYPLILEKGNTHSLRIDLNRFYRHDNRLKKYPKVRIIISERNGKRIGSESVFLRKTLVKF